MAGFVEIFERLPVVTYEPVGTIHRVRVIEAVALATAAEDFAADARSGRWPDEDEFLIRRRIHRDVPMSLGGPGWGELAQPLFRRPRPDFVPFDRNRP
jgi:hypothetical protein